MRILAIGLAAAVATAALPQGLPTVEAASAKARKAKSQPSSSPDQATTMTAIALAESKKKGLKAKTTTRRSGEKGGTEDINIGVGELQESKARPKLKRR